MRPESSVPARLPISSDPSLVSVSSGAGTDVSRSHGSAHALAPISAPGARYRPSIVESDSEREATAAAQALLEQSPAMLCVYDGRFAMRSVAGSTRALTGYSPAELLGDSLPIVVSNGLHAHAEGLGMASSVSPSGKVRVRMPVSARPVGGSGKEGARTIGSRGMTAFTLSASDSDTRPKDTNRDA